MSWEVRTMQSKTSYFNATLFRKNLTRFWPLWGLASFVGALFPLAVLLDMAHRGWNVLSAPDFTGMYYDAVSAVPVINLVYAALCAMAVWSYLYNARSVGLMHTLPIRREGLFLTNFLSGLSMTLIPYAVTGVLCVVVSLCGGAFDAKGLAVTVLAVLGESFFYFSSATFVAFITGNAFTMPPLYALLHFLAVLLVIIGMLVDVTPAILIIVPILVPAARAFGVDTLYFGLFVAMTLTMGLVIRRSACCCLPHPPSQRSTCPRCTNPSYPMRWWKSSSACC